LVLHLAALAEKERALISERTRVALAQKKAQGALLGNRTNLRWPRRAAVRLTVRLPRLARNVLPIVREIQASGRTSLRAIAQSWRGATCGQHAADPGALRSADPVARSGDA
jgi:DNA invertase Pin-like site-specific DNA recombinase